LLKYLIIILAKPGT